MIEKDYIRGRMYAAASFARDVMRDSPILGDLTFDAYPRDNNRMTISLVLRSSNNQTTSRDVSLGSIEQLGSSLIKDTVSAMIRDLTTSRQMSVRGALLGLVEAVENCGELTDINVIRALNASRRSLEHTDESDSLSPQQLAKFIADIYNAVSEGDPETISNVAQYAYNFTRSLR